MRRCLHRGPRSRAVRSSYVLRRTTRCGWPATSELRYFLRRSRAMAARALPPRLQVYTSDASFLLQPPQSSSERWGCLCVDRATGAVTLRGAPRHAVPCHARAEAPLYMYMRRGAERLGAPLAARARRRGCASGPHAAARRRRGGAGHAARARRHAAVRRAALARRRMRSPPGSARRAAGRRAGAVRGAAAPRARGARVVLQRRGGRHEVRARPYPRCGRQGTTAGGACACAACA